MSPLTSNGFTQSSPELIKSAEQGIFSAMCQLADLYCNGEINLFSGSTQRQIIKKDYSEAAKWFEKIINYIPDSESQCSSDETKDAQLKAQLNLAECYCDQEKYTQAIEVYKKVIANPKPEIDFYQEIRNQSLYQLAECYFQQNQDNEGVICLEKLRQEDDLREIFCLGDISNVMSWREYALEKLAYCYFEGRGVEKCPAQAAELLKKLIVEIKRLIYPFESHFNLSRISRDLAICYSSGKYDLEKNYDEAAKYFELAHEPIGLGICHYYGYGNLEKNVELAVKFFESALKENISGISYLWLAYLEYFKNESEIKDVFTRELSIWFHANSNLTAKENEYQCPDVFPKPRLTDKEKENVDNEEKRLNKINKKINSIDEKISKAAYDLFITDNDFFNEKYIELIDFIFPEAILEFLESRHILSYKVVLAFYHHCKNEKEKSLALLNEAASQNDILTYYLLGKHYKYSKAFDEATVYFKKVVEGSEKPTGYENDIVNRLVQTSTKEIADIEKRIQQLEHESQLNEFLEEKNKELNNLISMFAHNFLGTLQCIRSNAEHDNNPKIHLKTVKMMSGALTAFSIISADDDKLIEQLKQDNTGETNLLQNLANNLALAISQLLSKTNKDKIINLYLNYLRKENQIEKDTTSEELRENRDYRKKWQALQHQWEDEFNALFSENVELSSLQTWLADNFFPVQITGFDNYNIRFKEYGITDSIFLVVFMEILVNALKYMDVSQNQPLILTLDKQDQHYHLICENPSSQETYRGTHKGMDFLKSIARKLNAQFITESTEQQFKTTFIIPAELLD
jgi:TPR repeat protein